MINKKKNGTIFESVYKKLAITNTSFVRSLMNENSKWEARLIGIKGARGVGKNNFIVAVYQTEPSNG